MKRIGEKKLRDFHKDFRANSPEVFEICKLCRGKCEFNKIGTLLPGEKEFIAKQMGMSVEEFSNKYLDVLMVNGEPLDVLKFVEPCPFLNEKSECTCRSFKVVMCELYPIIFEVKGNKTVFNLDTNCPLTHHKKISEYFRKVGIPAFKTLDIPLNWFKLVEKYDLMNFDYKKIQKTRKSKNKCEEFHLDNLIMLFSKT